MPIRIFATIPMPAILRRGSAAGGSLHPRTVGRRSGGLVGVKPAFRIRTRIAAVPLTFKPRAIIPRYYNSAKSGRVPNDGMRPALPSHPSTRFRRSCPPPDPRPYPARLPPRALRGLVRRRRPGGLGDAMATYLGRGPTKALWAFGVQYLNLFIFFGAVWVAVIAIRNSGGLTRTRVLTLVGAVLVGACRRQLVGHQPQPALSDRHRQGRSSLLERSRHRRLEPPSPPACSAISSYKREREAMSRLHDEGIRGKPSARAAEARQP